MWDCNPKRYPNRTGSPLVHTYHKNSSWQPLVFEEVLHFPGYINLYGVWFHRSTEEAYLFRVSSWMCRANSMSWHPISHPLVHLIKLQIVYKVSPFISKTTCEAGWYHLTGKGCRFFVCSSPNIMRTVVTAQGRIKFSWLVWDFFLSRKMLSGNVVLDIRLIKSAEDIHTPSFHSTHNPLKKPYFCPFGPYEVF